MRCLVTEIAIVGMGAVFPGADDAPAFWRNIRSGTDMITDVPPDRWDPGIYCVPEEAGAIHFYCRRGGFLGEHTEFDPVQFGMMPSAVADTEPDQLLMLRVAAETIADCGTLPSGERVGVIIGRGGYIMPRLAQLDRRVTTVHQLMAVLRDLAPGLSRERLAAVRAAFEAELDPDRPESSMGLVPNFAAARLANRFDLRGPSYTLDAACASSLVAVDHAVRELASGRCDAVLAGGVHTCHHPLLWTVFTRMGALSRGGVIRPLSASADGTLLSEGAGAVLLKRLADARQAGDRIYAVIRGVGISSDGRATSMMNPLAEGQELAIRRAWAAAGLDPAVPDALGLLEAHGTATLVGDRVELTALGRVFGPPQGRPIGIGSVKSMIGHAMPAAGIAGLIKTAYALHEAVLPPTLHVEEPNPALAATRFEPVAHARPWDDGRVRRAAVSAFGFGGINAHVVLEADSLRTAEGAAAGPRRAQRARRAQRDASPSEAIVRLSAGSAQEMAALLRMPDSRLLERAGEEPGDGPYRLAVVAPDARRLELARKVAGRGVPWRGRGDIWFTPRPLLSRREQVAFVFPGLESGPAPRCEDIASAFGLPAPLLHGITADRPQGILQHALDVIATGRLIAAALDKLGIPPGVLAGHSLGEWTAMVVAGIYPDIDEFIASLRPGMIEVPDVVYLSLGTSADRAAELISGLDGVVITHDNCPRQTVACGPANVIDDVATRARTDGILAQPLPFRTGFHSPMLAPCLPAVRQSMQGLEVRAPQVPVWSATSLTQVPRDPDATRDLVLRHLVEPVRFRQLTGLLHDSGIRAFIQLGLGSLTGFIGDTLEGRDHVTVATAVPKRDGLAQLRRVATALWAEGLSPRFEVLYNPGGRPPVDPRLRGEDPTSTLTPLHTPLPGGTRQDPPGRSIPRASAPTGLGSSGGGVRLRFGVPPLVRLTGKLDSVPIGGAGALPADGPPGHPAHAEFNALLAEAAEAAESVVALMKRQPRPVPPVTRGAELHIEREFSLRTMPDLADHCLVTQPDGWPDDSDRFPVVPMTMLLEIMGDAALALRAGRVVVGLEQVRATRWLTVAPPTRTVVRAAPDSAKDGYDKDGNHRVRVSIEGYASGYVLLSNGYPAAPAPHPTPLRGQRPAPVAARELYTGGWMFHGPRFAGVASVGTLADDGITGTVLSLPARGALLDSVGQLIGHWMQVSATVDQMVLPAGIGAVRLYGPQPPTGQSLDCTVWIRQVTDAEMRADAEVRGSDGTPWCRIEGWAARRFTTDNAIWGVKADPGTSTISWVAPGGWNVAVEGANAASRELIMRRYLNAAERAEYEQLSPIQQRWWLLGRIAVKDAVRRSLWERGAGAIYPCELTVVEAGDGISVRGPFQAPPVSFAVSPPDSPGQPCAVAITGHSHAKFSVDIDSDATALVTESGRTTRLIEAEKG
jgi:acyl transferase domain-containing protein